MERKLNQTAQAPPFGAAGRPAVAGTPPYRENVANVAEDIARRLGLVLMILLGAVLLGIGMAWLTRDPNWLFVIVPFGIITSAIALLVVSWHDFVDLAEITLRLDLNRNGWLGRKPNAPAMDAEDETDLERRIHRALRYITEQGGDHTRRSICDNLKLMSQSEWKVWKDRCVQVGIMSADGAQVLAVSYAQACQMWDKDLPNSFVRVGDSEPRFVRKSGLFDWLRQRLGRNG